LANHLSQGGFQIHPVCFDECGNPLNKVRITGDESLGGEHLRGLSTDTLSNLFMQGRELAFRLLESRSKAREFSAFISLID
jgi:hypothetical protein